LAHQIESEFEHAGRDLGAAADSPHPDDRRFGDPSPSSSSNNTTTGPSRCLEAPCHGELQVDELAKVLEDSKHQTLAGN